MSDSLGPVRDDDTSRVTRAAYDDNADLYAEAMGNYRAFPGLREQLRQFIALTDQSRPILDAGCGPGRDSLEIALAGRKVISLDYSMAMLKAQPRAGGRQDLGLLSAMRLRVQADLVAIPIRDDSLGGIWACASLMHLHESILPKVVGDTLRILTPGAPIRASFKARGASGFVHGGSGILHGHRWVQIYSADELHHIFTGTGYTRVSVQQDKRSHDWWVVQGFRA